MNGLLLIRHGATAGNLEKRYIGRTDEPLCEKGILQIAALREQNFQIDRLFVSPMLRTRQTAELLFPGMAYAMVDDFRETDFGDFEGKRADELSCDAAYRAWVDSGCRAKIPGGEDVGDFKRRCAAAFAAVMGDAAAGERAGFILHGGVIMAIMEAFARPARSFYDWRLGEGAYYLCQWHPADGSIRAVRGKTET